MEHFQVLGDKKKLHRAFNNDAMSQMQIVESTQSTKVHSMKSNNSSKTFVTKFNKASKTYILYFEKMYQKRFNHLSVNESLK